MRPSQATAAAETPYSKSDLNNLVLNFLIIEGYESAAVKFAAEAGLQPKISTEHIHERVEIRTCIHRGEITQAIQLINELNPELLDTDPALHFMLLRLHLIELIKQHLASPSPWSLTALLEFAGTHLAPRAAADPAALTDLEQTMALLCFAPAATPPLGAAQTAIPLDASLTSLLEPSMRARVAESVNEGLLQSQGIMRESKLRALVRLFLWGEKKCGETTQTGQPATGTEGDQMVIC
ncbi:CTLH/CRA C-terminal to lish motif domain-domain-containing protein [Protomyces lactucae-debilis]|uniref:CTLH/CRA C-terminal to lish motif domain-domain-containing protein n=1 Tax=Protomyces lactucae-debilis TaxID=2754530 RepID=A0A1Y2FCN9_PROLT|nr:CTLH/CRA C-terminal to lish motif domain-containing protein [Protomyces lactucae-debilis]ORY81387.1 CTLH/CRA C-terminal to lish motif domain-domain-containing protein [Protomyces lactucae-debilis]